MRCRPTLSSIRALLSLLLFASAVAHAQSSPTFQDIAPVFAERCTLCHSGDGAPLGLRLDSFEGLMAGSTSGPVVVPGDAQESELVARLEGRSLPRMPLTGPPYLDEAQIALIREWIDSGASQGAVQPADRAPGQADDSAALPTPPSDDVTFASVETIFLNRCAVCHAENGALGAPPEGLRLDSYERILLGGERVVVVPGNTLASEVYRRIVGHSLPSMPFGGPGLSEEEISRIAAWIREGAQAPDGSPAPLPVGREVRLGGTLTALWELDGLPLLVGPQTRLDDDPGAGDYVEVRGVVTEDGGVRAERIRVR